MSVAGVVSSHVASAFGLSSKTWFPTWRWGSKGECLGKRGGGEDEREREKERQTNRDRKRNKGKDREEGRARGEGQRKPRMKPHVFYDLV